jgi:ankyrin repeat protein
MKAAIIGVAAIVVIAVGLYLSRQSLLDRGARMDQPASIALALKFGADKDAYADDGATPLFHAAASGNTEAVRRLIAKGADVNHKHRDNGMTPLMAAAGAGHDEIVDALLAAGADINLRDNDQLTAYTHAFRANHFEVAHKVYVIAKNDVPLPETTSTADKKAYTLEITPTTDTPPPSLTHPPPPRR